MKNPTVDVSGNKYWYNKQKELHREDGPAIEYAIGSKYWYKNGLLHREDGPAVECANGNKSWYVEGNCTGTTYFNETGEKDKAGFYELMVDKILEEKKIVPQEKVSPIGKMNLVFDKEII